MLKARVLTSLVLVAGFLGAVFLLPDMYWAFLMLAVIALAFHEWGGMAGLSTAGRYFYTVIPLLAGALVILADDIGMAELQPHGGVLRDPDGDHILVGSFRRYG